MKTGVWQSILDKKVLQRAVEMSCLKSVVSDRVTTVMKLTKIETLSDKPNSLLQELHRPHRLQLHRR